MPPSRVPDREPSLTVRVDRETQRKAKALAHDMGRPMKDVIADAVERYRRSWVIEETNRAYGALRADPEAWAEVEAERQAWDSTVTDGLEDVDG